MATEKQIEFYNEVRDQLEFYSIEAMYLFKDSPTTLCLIINKDLRIAIDSVSVYSDNIEIYGISDD